MKKKPSIWKSKPKNWRMQTHWKCNQSCRPFSNSSPRSRVHMHPSINRRVRDCFNFSIVRRVWLLIYKHLLQLCFFSSISFILCGVTGSLPNKPFAFLPGTTPFSCSHPPKLLTLKLRLRTLPSNLRVYCSKFFRWRFNALNDIFCQESEHVRHVCRLQNLSSSSTTHSAAMSVLSTMSFDGPAEKKL